VGTALFWVITQRVVVISFRRFGTVTHSPFLIASFLLALLLYYYHHHHHHHLFRLNHLKERGAINCCYNLRVSVFTAVGCWEECKLTLLRLVTLVIVSGDIFVSAGISEFIEMRTAMPA
jgi:hypothetical protein